MKVVLDTNIVLSGYLSNLNPLSPTGKILLGVFRRDFDLALSDYGLNELTRKMSESYPGDKQDKALRFVDLFSEMSEHVKIRGLDFGLRDERDNFLIETAYNSRSNFLITRDPDVLDDRKNKVFLQKHGTEIITPEKFCRVLRERTAAQSPPPGHSR